MNSGTSISNTTTGASRRSWDGWLRHQSIITKSISTKTENISKADKNSVNKTDINCGTLQLSSLGVSLVSKFRFFTIINGYSDRHTEIIQKPPSDYVDMPITSTGSKMVHIIHRDFAHEPKCRGDEQSRPIFMSAIQHPSRKPTRQGAEPRWA